MYSREEFQERVWQALEQEWALHGGQAASEDIYARLLDAGVEVPDHALNEVFDGWESRGFIRAPGLYDREGIRLHGARSSIVRGIRGQGIPQGHAPESGGISDLANQDVASPGEEQPPPIVPEAVVTPQQDIFEKIRRLGELRDEGLIREEEFEAKKRELLDRL